MKKIIFIFLTTTWAIVFSNTDFSHTWCGITQLQERDFDRFEYLYPQSIDSTHYRVHFTTEPADSFYWNNTWMTHESTIEYAITVLEQAEFAYSVFEDDGWEMPPQDCDDSILDMSNPNHCNNYGGNNLYDIYKVYDGTLINLYWWETENSWKISTTKGYDVTELKWSEITYENAFHSILKNVIYFVSCSG